MAAISIDTEKPVAYDSPDHIQPHGTALNNSTNRRFNRKLHAFLPPAEVRLLDIGCSGGGLVKSILDDGGFAVGIEGSDYSKKNKRAEWATIPDHLFTADVTVPFRLVGETGPGAKSVISFNVITAWEFFEHIADERINDVVANILQHLSPGGIVLASIATFENVVEGVRLHQTVQPKTWWISRFAGLGLARHAEIEHYFHYDWVRGAPDESSFPIALARTGEVPINLSRIKSLRRWNTPYEIMRSVYRARRRFLSMP